MKDNSVAICLRGEEKTGSPSNSESTPCLEKAIEQEVSEIHAEEKTGSPSNYYSNTRRVELKPPVNLHHAMHLHGSSCDGEASSWGESLYRRCGTLTNP